MADRMANEDFLALMASTSNESAAADIKAPSRLKSRIYSALIRRLEADGPLLDLSSTKASGRDLCVFENVAATAPVGTRATSFNLCRLCHARVMGERIEGAPIFWPHCPYAEFQGR